MRTEAERAYLAGLIDGEGCFTISTGVGRNQRVYHLLVVSITNCDRVLLEWVQGRWGGTISVSTRAGKGERQRQCYQLKFASKAVDALIPQILPYLVSKRRQAEIGLAFRRTVGGVRAENGNLTLEVLVERDRLHREMSSLNSNRVAPKFSPEREALVRATIAKAADTSGKAVCAQGHALVEGNLCGGKDARRRRCLTCHMDRQRARREAKRSA